MHSNKYKYCNFWQFVFLIHTYVVFTARKTSLSILNFNEISRCVMKFHFRIIANREMKEVHLEHIWIGRNGSVAD